MRFVELAEHLHNLRLEKSGRPAGAAMTVSEVWNGVYASSKTSISELRYYEAELPRPFDGMFVRLRADDESERALILVHKHLPKHWKEFAAIKEMMHCWSPPQTFVGSPESVKKLVSALCDKKGRYTPSVAADSGAILAAGEVILPHYRVERHIEQGHDAAAIANAHGLHPEVAELICRLDFLHHRKNGSL
ncbi:hypothetical protein [Paracoccus pantotrophus]|uniref:hypothetical protein n=1 Tax=Paracoccus pantotrophus TaxID=82367 RepID=UPI00048EE544|nr:hypothetical protein [Paracoccus pantotrophus]